MADPGNDKRIVTIPYAPRTWAQEFHETKKRWRVLVLHRRAGKTTGMLNHFQRDALQVQNSAYAYIAPTYKQAKLISWDILKEISRSIPNMKLNESELTAYYPTGSKIMLLGSENPDSLRGMKLWGGGQDEASQQPSNLFSEIISKCLADTLGYWTWAGTPKGKNAFYGVYQRGLASPSEFSVVYRTIDDSLRNELGQTIENLRRALEDDRKLVEQGLMTEDEFQQEWYCSFEAAIKGAYYARELAQARSEKRITTFPIDPMLKVYTVWDLGTGPRMAIGFYQKSAHDSIRMVDYWEGSESDGLPQAIVAIQSKGYVYGGHFAPHDIKATDIGSGKTRYDIAAQLGIRFEIIPDHGVDDGITTGRLVFPRLYIHSVNCEHFVDAIGQYRQEWDDKKGMFRPIPVHDWTSHPADVHRYMSRVESKFTNSVMKVYRQQPYRASSDFEGGDVLY